MTEELDAFERLSEILDTLRKECPWDKVQTMKSLRYLTIEEVHELSEAIVALEERNRGQLPVVGGELADASMTAAAQLSTDHQLTTNLKKELGDLAMHILFYCKIAEEEGLFTTADVYNTICDKLIDRHPFIYRKDEYHGESWEQLKMREGRKNVLEGVPDSLPSMVKAVRMQEKVAGMGDVKGEKADADGEDHLSPFTSHLSPSMSEEEFGDMLFAIIDWGRRHGINADDALCGANYRFKQKYSV